MQQPPTHAAYRRVVRERTIAETRASIGEPKHITRRGIYALPVTLVISGYFGGWTNVPALAVTALVTALATVLIVLVPMAIKRLRMPYLIGTKKRGVSLTILGRSFVGGIEQRNDIFDAPNVIADAET